MNQTYEIINELCKEKGTSYNSMCKQLGISPSTIGNLKSNPDRVLNAKYAARIASYLGVSVEYILYGEEQKNPVTDRDGKQLAIDFSKLTQEQIEIIQEVMQMNAQSLSVARPVIESLLSSQQVRDGQ